MRLLGYFASVVLLIGCSRHASPGSSARGLPPSLSSAESVSVAGPHADGTTATLHLATAVEEEPDAGLPVLAGKIVLHVGDSMVGGDGGLTKALDRRFTAEGAKFLRSYKVSESIVSFDKSPKLKELLAKHHPDIVILTLGTNDVFVPFPASMVGNIRNIIGRIGARECYWIGPPTWKPDTGIVQVLKDNVAPCKFFDSASLKLQRAGDGIHPTDRGGADWATSFWAFFRPGTAELGGESRP